MKEKYELQLMQQIKAKHLPVIKSQLFLTDSLRFLHSFSYSSSSSESSSVAGKREKPLGAAPSCLSFLLLKTFMF